MQCLHFWIEINVVFLLRTIQNWSFKWSLDYAKPLVQVSHTLKVWEVSGQGFDPDLLVYNLLRVYLLLKVKEKKGGHLILRVLHWKNKILLNLKKKIKIETM